MSTDINRVQYRISTEVDDPEWDAFLMGTPLGQFQQSSLWAQVKAGEGWNPHRVSVWRDGEIRGGWQLLWRRSPFGRLGYISKGPVITSHDPCLTRSTLQMLCEAIADLRLAVITLQPPDEDVSITPELARLGFFPDPTNRVIRSTLVIDVGRGLRAVEEGIHRTTWASIQQGHKRGLVVREGEEKDLPVFFQLMLETCRRQGEGEPNPSSVESLHRIWDVFRKRNLCYFFVAQESQEIVAGLLCLGFGRHFILWKKGWSGSHGDKRPNEVLTYAGLAAACQAGYAVADFASLQLDIARTLLDGGTLSAEQRSTRHFFNLKFGGQPKILPGAHLFFRSRILRAAYRVANVPAAAAYLDRSRVK